MENSQRMIQAQGDIIARQNEDMKQLQRRLVEAEHVYERPARFYMGLMEIILGHEIVKDEWDRFLMFVKMAVPEAEKILSNPRVFSQAECNALADTVGQGM